MRFRMFLCLKGTATTETFTYRHTLSLHDALPFEPGAKLQLAAPSGGSHGNSAAMAFDVELKMPEGEAVIRVIDVMTFNVAGQFTSMRAFWGPGDMEVLGTGK